MWVSGARVWDAALGHSVYSSPCLSAGLLAFGCHDGHVHGLEAGSGETRFTCETRGPVLSSPLAAGSRYPELALELARGEHPEPMLGEFRAGVVMTRFFSEVCLVRGDGGSLRPLSTPV